MGVEAVRGSADVHTCTAGATVLLRGMLGRAWGQDRACGDGAGLESGHNTAAQKRMKAASIWRTLGSASMIFRRYCGSFCRGFLSR